MGIRYYTADDIQSRMSSNSETNAQAVSYYLNTLQLGDGNYLSTNATSVNTWVTAMNNFQTNGGVIV